MGRPAEPRKGTPDPTLSQEEFKRRFLAQYIDPAFASLSAELDRIASAAYEGYSNSRKSPRTRKAGPGFADPDYDLSIDWLEARAAIEAAAKQHDDAARPRRILVVCGSPRNDMTCPGEMSKTFRLARTARDVGVAAGA